MGSRAFLPVLPLYTFLHFRLPAHQSVCTGTKTLHVKTTFYLFTKIQTPINAHTLRMKSQ